MARLRSAIALAALLACTSLVTGNALAQDLLTLTGTQEVPPNTSVATGTASIKIDADGNVSGTVSAPTLQARTAHIHIGAPGMNGPIIISLSSGDPGTFTVPEGAKLTPDQMTAYKAGNLYVNVHTAEHPGGEIRAQLKP